MPRSSTWIILLLTGAITATLILGAVVLLMLANNRPQPLTPPTAPPSIAQVSIRVTASATATLHPTVTGTYTPSTTPSPSITPTHTPTISATPSPTLTPSATPLPEDYVPPYEVPFIARPRVNSVVFQGPGGANAQIGTVRQGTDLHVIQRNAVGNWIRVQQRDSAGGVRVDGWVVTGFIALDPAFDLRMVAISRSAPEYTEGVVTSQTMAEIYRAPLVSPISDSMREVYTRGQSLGNDPRTITKVGDSVSANALYLAPMSNPRVELGAYGELADTIAYFGASAAQPSVASRIGMSTYTVLDPMWADKTVCEPNESPLACEYRVKKPIAAFIVFGPNDVRSMTETDFAGQIRKIIDVSLEMGVIPILSTFSVSPDDGLYPQALNFNRELVRLAAETGVPLINFWAGARLLPDYGLDTDGIHPKNTGFDYLKFDNGSEAYAGTALHNLLSIRLLESLRLTFGLR